MAVASGVTTITIPGTVTPTAGTIYDIILSTPIPDGTEGTQVEISNGTASTLYRYDGNYWRAHDLNSRTIIRAQFFNDPAHYVIIPRC